ncbi:MAG: hypothetical protein ABF379_10330 [Akkermansiaceae bacterium]
MNIRFFIGLALILLIGGAIIALKKHTFRENPPPAGPRTTSNTPDPGSKRSFKNIADKNLQTLQEIPNLNLSSAPTFSSIESRTKRLTIAQIEALLDEHTSHEGLAGWLRSALWAELGRRNHRRLFDKLVASLAGGQSGTSSFATDQALFAFLRGRAEMLNSFDDSLSSIFQDLNNISANNKSGYWKPHTITFLFSKLTAIDPDAAWDLLHDTPLEKETSDPPLGLFDNDHVASLSGFFQALPTEELATSYLKKWQPTLETPNVKKAYENYQTQINSRLSGFIAVPPEETIISQALASLARFNPEAAVTWLKEHEPNPEKPDYNRVHGMWRQLATHHPEQATRIFSQEQYLDPRRANIGWMIQFDYSLLPEAITQTEKASHQTQIIHSVLSSSASNHVNDFFPTPDGPNRLPNFQQRHDYLLEAINLGTYHEKQKESLLKSLAREFSQKLGTQ